MDGPKDGRDGRAENGAEGAAGSAADEAVLHGARALVLADLTARDVAEADVVSLVEDALSKRRWWLQQWAEGAAYVPGLLAQDVQDALLETFGRWPLCPRCEDPHALAVEPELGPDPHWVCEAVGEVVAPVGALGPLGPSSGGGRGFTEAGSSGASEFGSGAGSGSGSGSGGVSGFDGPSGFNGPSGFSGPSGLPDFPDFPRFPDE